MKRKYKKRNDAGKKKKKIKRPCIRCLKTFESWDRKKNQICPDCIDYINDNPYSEDVIYAEGVKIVDLFTISEMNEIWEKKP